MLSEKNAISLVKLCGSSEETRFCKDKIKKKIKGNDSELTLIIF